jgi:hypothetical protein
MEQKKVLYEEFIRPKKSEEAEKVLYGSFMEPKQSKEAEKSAP